MSAGADALEPFTPAGAALHLELELLVEPGLPPAAALRAATIRNARVLKQSKVLGSIDDGKLADRVILDANPLDEIRNTRKVWKIINEGRLIDRESLLYSRFPVIQGTGLAIEIQQARGPGG